MINKYTKVALTALIIATSTTNNISAMFELKTDGSSVTVNGQNIEHSSHRNITNTGFSIMGGWLAYKYLTKPEQSPNSKFATIIAGTTLGSIATDVLYKDISTETILSKTAYGLGTIAGASLQQEDSLIKDAGSLGGHLGSMAISTLYSDHNTTLLSAGQAAGEQLGMHLISEQYTLTGKAIGSNCGAAFIAHMVLKNPIA